jgi:Domain of unknown function (DUF4359)
MLFGSLIIIANKKFKSMKSAIITGVGVLGLFLLAVVMVKSNPSEASYQQYAVTELSSYVKSNVCKKSLDTNIELLDKLIDNQVKNQCNKFVDVASPRVREIIAASTERHDFVIFSVYRTEFKVNELLPSYKLETIGAFDKFYTYNAQQN